VRAGLEEVTLRGSRAADLSIDKSKSPAITIGYVSDAEQL